MNAAALLVAVGLLSGGPTDGADTQAGPPRRVVLISLDGLRPDAINAAPAATLQSLIAAGSYTDTCLNELPPATLPNHASMVTGLPVARHGVVLNHDLPGYIESPTILDLASAAGRRVAFFASKSKMGYLCRPESAAVRVLDFDIDALTDAIVAEFASPTPPDLTFIHYGQPDGAGHQDGWMSAPYLEQVRHVDALVQRVLDALHAAGLRGETLLCITADHGGLGNNHALNVPEVRFIPFILCGPGVPAGHEFCKQMHVYDAAAIALAVLGVDPPANWPARVPADVLAGAAATAPTEVGSGDAASADCQPVPAPYLGLPCAVWPLSLAAAGTVLAYVFSVWPRRAMRRRSGRG